MGEGEKATLRPLAERDLDALVAWDEDSDVADLMGGSTRTQEESKAKFMALMRDRNSAAMAIESDAGVLIGDIELIEIAWRSGDAELVVRIGEPAYWNRGYGSEAVRAVLELAFGQMGLRRVYLRVCANNARAIRCYSKCGFRCEGVVRRRFGDTRDPRIIVLMTILRDDFIRMRVAS
ncbi:MAG: GNAT family N-acetyltransferase [Clostridia bacterium]|nr:GNAT family N-acetyltransferase [Clostridia bacterium]